MLTAIDTGDTVRHRPSGEEWLVARVVGERLYACGWPPTLADLKDCTLVKRATAEERIRLLHGLAAGQHDHAGWAREALQALGVVPCSGCAPPIGLPVAAHRTCVSPACCAWPRCSCEPASAAGRIEIGPLEDCHGPIAGGVGGNDGR